MEFVHALHIFDLALLIFHELFLLLLLGLLGGLLAFIIFQLLAVVIHGLFTLVIDLLRRKITIVGFDAYDVAVPLLQVAHGHTKPPNKNKGTNKEYDQAFHTLSINKRMSYSN